MPELPHADAGHNGSGELGEGKTGGRSSWMDEKRKNLAAYEYLCRIGEAKQWLEACIQDELPPITTLDESLRNGIVLAKLTRAFEPDLVRKIFEDPKLQYRHSDNINYCFAFMKKVGLPNSFMFELTDLYDLKNFPKVIYAIHALSHLLARKGIAPKIKSLVGKLSFTDAEVDAMQENLDKAGVSLPSFGNVNKTLEKEMAPEKTPEELRQEYLAAHATDVTKCQAAWRACQGRKQAATVRKQKAAAAEARRKREEHERHVREVQAPAAVAIQSAFRGHVGRQETRARRAELKRAEPGIVYLQARVRGFLARKQALSRRNFYSKNEQAIVAIQSWLKGKKQSSAYSALQTTDNPPLPVAAKFIHLMDVGAHDAEDELEVETMKQQAVKQIRENAALEQHLNELDIKIALLVKNRTTLDEVVKISSKKLRKAVSDEEIKAAAQVFSLKSLDKQSRTRLEAYQTMFYLLQTQPMYLTRLLWVMRNWSSEVVKRLIETCVLTVFSFAQNAREEYLLLKLLEAAIELEVNDVKEPGDFVQGNPAFIKLVLQYVRGAKERQFLSSVLSDAVSKACACPIDLETDPIQVYKLLIKEEESTTGQKSAKRYDVTRDEALKDPATMDRVQKNYRQLEQFVATFMQTITGSLARMPYGIRFIAKRLNETLLARFPKEKPEALLRIVGNLIYYRYMNPAIVAPDAFDVTNDTISPLNRKNLSEISKMLNIIATGKTLDGHLHTIAGSFVEQQSSTFVRFLQSVMTVPAPERYLNVDIYSDAARTTKPVIYISANEIFFMHATLHQHMDEVCSSDKEDPMRAVLVALGNAPPYQQDKTGPEISLTLAPNGSAAVSSSSSGGPSDYATKKLYVATKKQLVLIIRSQPSGANVLDLLEGPVSEKDEDRYQTIVAEVSSGTMSMSAWSISKGSTANLGSAANIAGSGQNGSASNVSPSGVSPLPASAIADLPNSLQQLKIQVLEAMAKLEKAGVVTRKDKYQSMLTSIVADIRNKHKRREQVRSEKAALDATLATLNDKNKFLVEQQSSYSDYINACIQRLTEHAGAKKKKSVLPFSRHARHMRDLERQNKAVPKFGSFKYSAKELTERGIIVAINVDGLPTKLYEKLAVTLSSNEQGLFDIECAFNALGLPSVVEHDTVKLEDLLALQFENKTEVQLFDGAVTANVNLLTYFINKKCVPFLFPFFFFSLSLEMG
ncbi:hypothetical protein BC828DRAFT_345326 [Blastocladiella britannica]|nr:hypothetical protein BC828DRAFT_345326 [Blastocladiella britannica]